MSKRHYVLIAREEVEGGILGFKEPRDSFWTGERWVPEKDAAKPFSTSHEAAEARRWLDTDRDVLILVVVGDARSSASA